MSLPTERNSQQVATMIANWTPLHPAPANVTPQLPDADWGKAVRFGLWVLGVGFGGFFAWAAYAPLDEAVPANGVVSVESKRKRIDHSIGGIIESIAVREGQRVHEGDELIVLNETQSKAALNATQSQWRVAAATAARLKAEQAGLPDIAFPPELTALAADAETRSVMRAQEELFRSRRSAQEGELGILREAARGLELQLRSLDQLKAGRAKQISLFKEQLASLQKLNAQGFVSRNQLLDIERQLAEVQSKQSEDLANIAGIKARLSEFRMRGAQREVEYRREVETQLADVQREAATLGERLTAQRDTYSRLAIRAPVAGTVVDIAFHTVGGTLKPGERILDIVPDGDDLIVEAQVPPQYIDRLHAGLPASVHFDAYMSRADRPVVTGSVSVVSADALVDARSGAQYYAMRVTVPAEELQKLGGLKLQPGMQGTVMVKTGERPLLTYLARPLLRRFSTALSEN